MTLAVQVIAILFMLTMMFLGIWSFVIANKAYRQIKYKNYLLEKIAHNISLIRNKEKIFDNLNDMDDSVSYSEIKENLLDKDDIAEPALEEDIEISKEIEDAIEISEK
ncbi:hypothetical protein [Clostridium sp. LIBA-8841]|uniref:hypothetical protein n=1 Tax=Clostridium sp. LIBA-8841 TaxID=2987530 RepID=UPI002AC42DC8|nr:hypothetical protein [Clostridium sp. LIBA-8841]MDZ5255091.1 hypothetical protein [Clostridium sp. LIBA-8841]